MFLSAMRCSPCKHPPFGRAMGEEFPTQSEEKAFFGLHDGASFCSADSAEVNQRLAESFCWDDYLDQHRGSEKSPPPESQAAADSETEVEVLYDPRDLRPRPSAIAMAPTRGVDSNGAYRLTQGISLSKTCRGGCIHFSRCRHLGRMVEGLWVEWRSNVRLQKCNHCLSRIHASIRYEIDAQMVAHSPGCSQVGEVIHRLKGCSVCVA